MGGFIVVFLVAWGVFMGFAISGAFDNHTHDPRVGVVGNVDSNFKVCAGKNLVEVQDNSFWGNHPRVTLTVINAPECR